MTTRVLEVCELYKGAFEGVVDFILSEESHYLIISEKLKTLLGWASEGGNLLGLNLPLLLSPFLNFIQNGKRML